MLTLIFGGIIGYNIAKIDYSSLIKRASKSKLERAKQALSSFFR